MITTLVSMTVSERPIHRRSPLKLLRDIAICGIGIPLGLVAVASVIALALYVLFQLHLIAGFDYHFSEFGHPFTYLSKSAHANIQKELFRISKQCNARSQIATNLAFARSQNHVRGIQCRSRCCYANRVLSMICWIQHSHFGKQQLLLKFPILSSRLGLFTN